MLENGFALICCRVINKEWHTLNLRGRHIIYILTHKKHTVRMINAGHLTQHKRKSAVTLGSSTGCVRSALPLRPADLGPAPGVPRHAPRLIAVHPAGEAFDAGLESCHRIESNRIESCSSNRVSGIRSATPWDVCGQRPGRTKPDCRVATGQWCWVFRESSRSPNSDLRKSMTSGVTCTGASSCWD